MSFTKKIFITLIGILQVFLLPANLTAGTVLIDRVPPTIYETAANPMNLSPASDVPFTTTIVYKINDTSDCTASITITNQSTGEVVATYNPAPANTNGINQANQANQANQGSEVIFRANSTLPKGAYRADITVSDKYGNLAHAYVISKSYNHCKYWGVALA